MFTEPLYLKFIRVANELIIFRLPYNYNCTSARATRPITNPSLAISVTYGIGIVPVLLEICTDKKRFGSPYLLRQSDNVCREVDPQSIDGLAILVPADRIHRKNSPLQLQIFCLHLRYPVFEYRQRVQLGSANQPV